MGAWRFGGALLLLQGAAALCWLGARSGGRGLRTGLLVGALAFVIEYIGVTTGVPFGRYRYTDVLQPQLLGTVPLAICAAWVMVVPSALVLAQTLTPGRWGARAPLLVAATLVLLLDLQIETVATRVNRYWVWLDSGRYYGVSSGQFLLLGGWSGWRWRGSLGYRRQEVADAGCEDARTRGREDARTRGREEMHPVTPSPHHPVTLSRYIPHALYVLSTAMFAVTNVARGYFIAGVIGVAALVVIGGTCWSSARDAVRWPPAASDDQPV